jgi:hypothetical protein
MPPGYNDVLRDEFVRMFDQFEAIDTPWSLYEFQVALADAIRRVEPASFAEGSSPQKDHLRRLRRLGDGVAWKYLHPHAIRQLAKNDGGSPPISVQKGFNRTLSLAEGYAKDGLGVVIADLTTCIRVGDVIVCTDPERPAILESGGHPAWNSRGRKGRQHRRGRAIQELLHIGAGFLDGQAAPVVTVEISIDSEHSWPALETAITRAINEGFAAVSHGPGDVIVAVENVDDTATALKQAAESVAGWRRVEVGIIRVLEHRPDPRIAPPSVWAISAASRLAVLLSDVYIAHLVDPYQFLGRYGDASAVVAIKAVHDVESFIAQVHDSELELSGHFLDDVLFGFSTIDSTRNRMLAFAQETTTIQPDLPGIAPGDVLRIDSVEDAVRAVSQAREPNPPKFVSIPGSVLDDLISRLLEGPESDSPKNLAVPSD